jgi:hypothetical protein
MTRLVWNKTGERKFEAGVDRGVLYLPDGSGVPWNGLIGVEEDLSNVESTPYYYDGVKYLDTRYPGDFSATLRAYTYPDEFLQFDGYADLAHGALLAHQPVYDRFSLSYRTHIGNDVDGPTHGYKIHILYNLVATPDNRSYPTLSRTVDPTDLSWKIAGVPEHVPGYRPTVHLVLDTTRLDPHLVADIEALLYGEDEIVDIPVEDILDGGSPTTVLTGDADGGLYNSTDLSVIEGGRPSGELSAPAGGSTTSAPAKLPPMADIIALLNTWVLITITDNGDGTWTADGPDDLINMTGPTTFQIAGANAVMLDANTYEISSTSSF